MKTRYNKGMPMLTTPNHNQQRPFEHLLAAIAGGTNTGMFELDQTPYYWRLLGDVVEIRAAWDNDWQVVRNPLAIAAEVGGHPVDFSMPLRIYRELELMSENDNWSTPATFVRVLEHMLWSRR